MAVVGVFAEAHISDDKQIRNGILQIALNRLLNNPIVSVSLRSEGDLWIRGCRIESSPVYSRAIQFFRGVSPTYPPSIGNTPALMGFQ